MSKDDFEFDAKFPGQGNTGLAPYPSTENPGRVFPRTDPNVPIPEPPPTTWSANRFVGNPYLMHNALNKVDHAFGEVITILEQERNVQNFGSKGDGGQNHNNNLLEKFRSWRNELIDIRSGKVGMPMDPSSGGGGGEEAEGGGGIFRD